MKYVKSNEHKDSRMKGQITDITNIKSYFCKTSQFLRNFLQNTNYITLFCWC